MQPFSNGEIIRAVGIKLAELRAQFEQRIEHAELNAARIKEQIDEYGNVHPTVIDNRFGDLQQRLHEQVVAAVAAIDLGALRGAPGEKGEPGPPGERGLDGPPGAAGESGPPGAPGERGEPGTHGRPGERGEKGDPGEAGRDGLPGAAGAPGVPGPQGERGEPGTHGRPGERGEKGDRGEPGPVGRARGRWDAGTAYQALDMVAHNGSEWRAITDNPGPLPGDGWMLSAKGMKGAPGDKGPPGERGPPGPAGPAGRGIADIRIDNGVLTFELSDGRAFEFMLETTA